ncbi:hypothetical protein, partial [Escherichia coli]|uniref:hypothetical protein n=1 Tax=Escherichia coli TaxID=562 RepID=UPI0032B592DD
TLPRHWLNVSTGGAQHPTPYSVNCYQIEQSPCTHKKTACNNKPEQGTLPPHLIKRVPGFPPR